MDIWQVLGTPQIAEITAVVSIIVSVSLAQKPSPSKKKKNGYGQLLSSAYLFCKSQGFAGEIGTSIWDGKGLNIRAIGRERPAELYYFLPQSPGIGRTTLSGGSLIIEFEKVEAVCVGKSLRPLMVS